MDISQPNLKNNVHFFPKILNDKISSSELSEEPSDDKLSSVLFAMLCFLDGGGSTGVDVDNIMLVVVREFSFTSGSMEIPTEVPN